MFTKPANTSAGGKRESKSRETSRARRLSHMAKVGGQDERPWSGRSKTYDPDAPYTAQGYDGLHGGSPDRRRQRSQALLRAQAPRKRACSTPSGLRIGLNSPFANRIPKLRNPEPVLLFLGRMLPGSTCHGQVIHSAWNSSWRFPKHCSFRPGLQYLWCAGSTGRLLGVPTQHES